MSYYRSKILLFVCCLFTHACFAGDTVTLLRPWSGFGVEVNPFVGKVFKHNAKFHVPIPDLTTGVDVNLQVHTWGKKPWQQRRNYPTVGLGITYTNYGIDSIYGQCIGIYPNIVLTLLKAKDFEWTLRIGDGIGYVTRRYDRKKPGDTINKAIGSHLNDFAFFATDLRYHINEHWDVQLGANFTHISDASFRKPNLGVNMYGGHIGLSYYPVTSKPAHIKRNLRPLKNRILGQVRLSYALVSSYAPKGPLYPVYLASGFVSRRWISKNKAFIGLDYSYHSDIYAFQRNNEINLGEEKKYSSKSAVFFGNEFLLGRVGVVLQVGVYVKQAYLKYDAYYQKIGGHFYIVQREPGNGPIKELFISAFLKTHKTIAELGEFGIGVGF
ncbi:MAG: deacylase [Flavipsychrobacter sp.]|jgi:hypothetical protein|nr:deacylase [Flavipsychrobacter sp.]